MEKKNLLDQVDDGFNYFNDRMEELKTDDIYYIKAFMKYIQELESEVGGLRRQFINKF